MAVARIIDAVERDRRGDFRARRGDRDGDRRGRSRKQVISDAPIPVPTRAKPMPDLAEYVSGLLHEADVQVDAVDAWALPARPRARRANFRSEEHTSELQSLMRISYAVFCLKKKNIQQFSQCSAYFSRDSYDHSLQ